MILNKARTHIVREIEALNQNILNFYPEDEPLVYEKELTSLVKYLLGSEDDIPNKLSVVKLNQQMLEIMIRLRCPAYDFPFKSIEFTLEHPLMRV